MTIASQAHKVERGTDVDLTIEYTYYCTAGKQLVIFPCIFDERGQKLSCTFDFCLYSTILPVPTNILDCDK